VRNKAFVLPHFDSELFFNGRRESYDENKDNGSFDFDFYVFYGLYGNDGNNG
jgi:hypothetical protein